MPAFTVTQEDPYSREAIRLMQELYDDLGVRYHNPEPGSFNPSDTAGKGSVFLIVWLEERGVGCGAVRPFAEGVGEVKRMYVAPEVRGRGVARHLLAEIEEAARKLGYGSLCLETGTAQPEAMGLYESAGYHRIPNYGQYADDPVSVCYAKEL
jgi:putative acetyltransferase